MPLSDVGRSRAYARRNADPYFDLVTITHPELPIDPDTSEPKILRFVSRRKDEDIVSNGETYKAYPFRITWPDSQSDQPPRATVEINAVQDPSDPDNDVVAIVRGLRKGPIKISLFRVLRSQPDVIESKATGLLLSSIDFDRQTISGDLGYKDWLGRPYPYNSYNKAQWPGMHQ